jgi:ankyrin repeat protein
MLVLQLIEQALDSREYENSTDEHHPDFSGEFFARRERQPKYLPNNCSIDSDQSSKSTREFELSSTMEFDISYSAIPAPYYFLVNDNDSQQLLQALNTANGRINRATKQGTTPLHLACQYGISYAVQALLNNGASPFVTRADGNGCSLLAKRTIVSNFNSRIDRKDAAALVLRGRI